jgi:transcription initiation factor TFIIIB Brf1 subunit/transcription initiation factor TFIIB
MDKWTKYSYVCTACDSLFEVTLKDPKTYEPQCCGFVCQTSVVDATIESTEKKEDPMETAQPLEFYEELVKNSEARIKHLEYANENLNKSVNDYYTKVQRLRNYIIENAEEMEMFAEEIAFMFDIALTKEIEFEATVTVTGTIEVPVFGDFDLDDFVNENLYVDSANGDVVISGHEVDSVRDIS